MVTGHGQTLFTNRVHSAKSFSFVRTRKLIVAKLSIRKLGCSSVALLALMKIRAYGSKALQQ